MGSIDDYEALAALIGTTPPAIALKVIDHLDAGALHWLGESPVAFLGVGGRMTIAGSAPGFARGERGVLRVPRAAIDDDGPARPGESFASLFLAPGIGETLRINGHVAGVDADEISVAVEECYVHCAKALIRSAFWTAPPHDASIDDPQAFVAAGGFLAIATIDAGGHADVSPKGDPAGLMARFDEDAFWYADRPGNRRVDSFRNILTNPRFAGALLVPGSTQVAIVEGHARLTTDDAARARFAVQGKQPLLVTKVTDARITLRDSSALRRARLWPVTQVARDIDPAAMFIAHMKLNRGKSVAAKLAAAAVSVPGVMHAGLERDYKTNLY